MASEKDVVLEPCPLCRRHAFLTPDNEVWCVTDRCLKLPARETREEAAAAWNTRLSSLPTHGEDVVELLIPHIGREVDIRTEGLVSALIPICEAYDLNDCAERDEEDALEISIGDLRCLIDALAALDSGAIARSALSVLDQEVVEALKLRDAAVGRCPIQRKYQDVCPRCQATSSESCGIVSSADYAFVEAARTALSRISQGEGG